MTFEVNLKFNNRKKAEKYTVGSLTIGEITVDFYRQVCYKVRYYYNFTRCEESLRKLPVNYTLQEMWSEI